MFNSRGFEYRGFETSKVCNFARVSDIEGLKHRGFATLQGFATLRGFEISRVCNYSRV